MRSMLEMIREIKATKQNEKEDKNRGQGWKFNHILEIFHENRSDFGKCNLIKIYATN